MKPKEVSLELNRIANLLESSKNPSKDLVISDLTKLVNRIASTENVQGKVLTTVMGPNGSSATVDMLLCYNVIDMSMPVASGKLTDSIDKSSKERKIESYVDGIREFFNRNYSFLTVSYDYLKEPLATGYYEMYGGSLCRCEKWSLHMEPSIEAPPGFTLVGLELPKMMADAMTFAKITTVSSL